MLVEVLRPIPAGGEVIAAGAVVDASGWANLPVLLGQGYVRAAATPPPVPADNIHADTLLGIGDPGGFTIAAGTITPPPAPARPARKRR